MFDLHSHVLPYIDDGAKDMETSLAMLKMAKEQGVNTVVATPHCVAKDSMAVDVFAEKRRESYEKLLLEIKNKSDYPEILLGSEVYLCGDISEFENLSSLCYQNTNYILLEMTEDIEPSQTVEWIYNISVKGYRPVIAHVDRYSFYAQIMRELSHVDVVYQINSSRFLTMTDRRHLKNVFKYHNRFLASSDMHNLTSRVCNMAPARKIAQKKFSTMCPMLFEEGAEAMLNNRAFPEY